MWENYLLGLGRDAYHKYPITFCNKTIYAKNVFDEPSLTPYSSDCISRTLNGQTVYFPLDAASRQEAFDRGMYVNHVAAFHSQESPIDITLGDAAGDYKLNNERIYYYPVVGYAIDDLFLLENNKQYIIRTKDEARGSLGVANGELASTNPTAIGHKCEEATPFAILQYDGNYYLYSTADHRFITNTGGETDAPGQNGTHAVTLTKNTGGYFMFSFTYTGNVLNVNDNPGIAINEWGQTEDKWDDGNQFSIEEVGDFDPTEALAMFGTEIIETTDAQYLAALQTVGTDVQYCICTDYNGIHYYLTQDGYLTDTPQEECIFTFYRTEGGELFRSPGWKLDACFSNPQLSNGATGDLNPQGHLLPDKTNNRTNWEGQVWYLGAYGSYAVRATNANSNEWGANTYWTVLDTDSDGQPEADYSWTPAFVWQIEDAQALIDGIDEINNEKIKIEGSIYDLSGRQIVNRQSSNGKLPRGIYIRNGKKFVIK